ncbi:hypothetical protein [Niabella hibiscisoli]|uniref:hypothetical protein n=1 Tax=Niabella hibiscisoli TaxID=1825928 RepID=UPI001F0D503B|nr:hypothetical protein [Niabella hibiscisoli]MCH5715581.1 hypothetical protein [Niabella hibiscisoli]
MQKKILWLALIVTVLNSLALNAQYAREDSTHKKWFVGSTLFLLGNFSTVNPPNLAQLNVGYRITGRDVVSLELITWKYAWPLGINPFFNQSYGKAEEKFPGYIRDYGIALVYQRFFWKGFYAAAHVMPMFQTFVNEKGKKVDNGFHIFTTYRAGYHVKLFKDRFLYSHQSVLPVAFITRKCLMVSNKRMTSGASIHRSQGCILVTIFSSPQLVAFTTDLLPYSFA